MPGPDAKAFILTASRDTAKVNCLGLDYKGEIGQIMRSRNLWIAKEMTLKKKVTSSAHNVHQKRILLEILDLSREKQTGLKEPELHSRTVLV